MLREFLCLCTECSQTEKLDKLADFLNKYSTKAKPQGATPMIRADDMIKKLESFIEQISSSKVYVRVKYGTLCTKENVKDDLSKWAKGIAEEQEKLLQPYMIDSDIGYSTLREVLVADKSLLVTDSASRDCIFSHVMMSALDDLRNNPKSTFKTVRSVVKHFFL